MQRNLTEGPITKNILLFALPLMVGNLLQQLYNIADTWVVGRFLGANALAAVGSSYTFMTFLTSIFIGLCMGSGSAISMQYGEGDSKKVRQSVFISFVTVAIISIILNIVVYLFMDFILKTMQVPIEIRSIMKQYLEVIFLGIIAIFLYNYFANLLRAIGNSVVPLVFLAISSIINILLDILCVLILKWGVRGAAIATVFSQYLSAIGIIIYTFIRVKEIIPRGNDMKWDKQNLFSILNLSIMTSIQQSIMNFGILMVQGIVNSFGTSIMAAFAAAVKIDSFGYMPVQDFGNAFSTYVAQNYGAKNEKRITKGIKSGVITTSIFCIIISAFVVLLAKPLMCIFINSKETQIISEGVKYLSIEGSCYIGIGILFLLYGYYRAVNKPVMSVILTIISLGTRVALAYTLSSISTIGVVGIWISVPIGWALADIVGIAYYFKSVSHGRTLRQVK
ncbi:MATE family efflux transporter [Clostridium sp. MSJ-8]|uniref:MATE family efflux transporter n=1 Tax=Clostridium sp. MSJ-8 TaxID=2841510 RepID=UPI001C0EC591|nr:MATE family efflux transporter [Clostridium sp. MSJ-8]MBU5488155.1 MATE family efflux transporter [Clostridium sp. MSJ-8]